MLRVLLLVGLIIPICCRGQSASTHYQTNHRGSTTHGGHSTTGQSRQVTINVWYEGHAVSAPHHQGRSSMPGGMQFSKDTISRVKHRPYEKGDLFLWPNPAGERVYMDLGRPLVGFVWLDVFTVDGIRVCSRKVSQTDQVGLSWDLTDDRGRGVRNGMYLVRVVGVYTRWVGKLIVLR